MNANHPPTKNPSIPLSAWQEVLDEQGTEAALSELAAVFSSSEEWHKLFEVRQMQVRNRLGVAMHYPPNLDTLTVDEQNELERGLIEACREVGFALLDNRQIPEAWMYLRAVGDKSQVADRLRTLHLAADTSENQSKKDPPEPDSERIEQAIHLALYEGVDPAWGLSLLLQHHGTCNSITTLSGLYPGLDRETRGKVAGTLVDHLHDELLSNIRSDLEHRGIEDQVDDAPASDRPIERIILGNPELMANQGHHIDLSHLMSTVQFARSTDDPSHWQKALDMAEYGSRLSLELISPGEEPFEEFYPMHRAYYAALLGKDVEEHLASFARRAHTVDRDQSGPQAAETYVDLLARMGRYVEAAAASVELLPPGTPTLGIAPTVLELSEQARDFTAFLSLAEQRNDLLAFAQGRLAKLAPGRVGQGGA